MRGSTPKWTARYEAAPSSHPRTMLLALVLRFVRFRRRRRSSACAVLQWPVFVHGSACLRFAVSVVGRIVPAAFVDDADSWHKPLQPRASAVRASRPTVGSVCTMVKNSELRAAVATLISMERHTAPLSLSRGRLDAFSLTRSQLDSATSPTGKYTLKSAVINRRRPNGSPEGRPRPRPARRFQSLTQTGGH